MSPSFSYTQLLVLCHMSLRLRRIHHRWPWKRRKRDSQGRALHLAKQRAQVQPLAELYLLRKPLRQPACLMKPESIQKPRACPWSLTSRAAQLFHPGARPTGRHRACPLQTRP